MKLLVAPLAAFTIFLDANQAIAQEPTRGSRPAIESGQARSGSGDRASLARATFDDRATGDWDGRRTTLLENGVSVSVSYINESLGNTAGGARRTAAYADQIALGVDLDFGRLWGWRGGSFHVVITNRNGRQLDTKAGLGTLLEVHEIFGRGHYTRLTRFYVEQDLFDERVTVKAGRGDVDFFPLSCDFVNISFCGALPGYHSNGWYTWPIGQYFANVTVRPAHAFYVKVGANDVNPRNLDGDQGLRLVTPGADTRGTLSNVEGGWLPTFGDTLAGAYRAGYWRDSTAYPDLLLNQQGQPMPLAGGVPRMHDTSTGFYAMAQQQLTHNGTGGGLLVFGNLSHAETDVSRVDRLLSTGVWWTGIFESRPMDRLGIAFGRNRVGARIRAFERLHGAGGSGDSSLGGNDSGSGDNSRPRHRRSEQPFEVNYSIAVSRGFRVTPTLQYVRSPGGRDDVKSPVILGIRFSAEF
jgi:porin